jgi:hypothetical protein
VRDLDDRLYGWSTTVSALLVEAGDLRGQFEEALHPEGGELLRVLGVPLDRRPRPPVHERRQHAGLDRGPDVVVDAVADVQHLAWLGRDHVRDTVEERGVRLARAPVVADVPIRSTSGVKSSRRIRPARVVWLPAMPSHRPSARSAARVSRTSGYRSSSPNVSGWPAAARFSRRRTGRSPAELGNTSR